MHCLREPGGAVRFRRTPFVVTGANVYLEGQYYNRHKRINVIGFGVLRFAAGLIGGAYKLQGCTVYVLDPIVWRESILPGSGRVPKTVLHNRAARAGFFDGVTFPDEGIEDAKDAFLISVAGARLHTLGTLPEPLEWCAHDRRKTKTRKPRSAAGTSKGAAKRAKRVPAETQTAESHSTGSTGRSSNARGVNAAAGNRESEDRRSRKDPREF